jgi:primary-amine oxidase
LYGNELYPSIPAFRETWRAPGFKKMKVNHGGDWINVESTGEEEGLMLDDRAPPRQVSVGGQRFKVDEKERYVEWMDFTFFITYVYLSGESSVGIGAERQFYSRYRDEASRYQVSRREDHIFVRA